MLTTTLQTIWNLLPKDEEGKAQKGQPTRYWNGLLEGLGKTEPDDEPITLLRILESCGWRCAIATTDAFPGHERAIRLYGCYCARYILHFFEENYTENKRLHQEYYPEKEAPRQAIETAERFALGNATVEELADAEADAEDADWDATHAALDAWLNIDAEGAAEDDGTWDAASAAACAQYAAREAAAAATEAATYLHWGAKGFRDDAWGYAKREFIRLCRLEGEYGEVDKLDNP